jgi:replication-associated recombination protein RarA
LEASLIMAPGISPNEDPVRTARLKKLLDSYVHGTRSPKSSAEGKLLLEAIASQDDRASCVERLVGSKNALAALRLALRFDTGPNFLNATLKDFLNFLEDPAISHICVGQLLKQLLRIVVSPTTLWNAFVAAFTDRQLGPEGERAFAWLLLELVSWTDKPPIDVDSIARDLSNRKIFIKSDNQALRTIGYRIDHVLQTKGHAIQRDDFGPGGRHDNDHVDFRKITICPTHDELSSKQTPFYLPANAITHQAFEKRPGVHLDNQFRLLREDFLAELREDVHVSQGHSKTRRPRTRLRGLSLAGAYFGTDKFRTPFALALSVRSGLEGFAGMPSHRRKAFLKDNPKFLKHQSFGCILDGERIIAFATLLRVEDLLAEEGKWPLIVLCMPDSASLESVLLTLKSSDTLEFLMVDTPIFAYEPVLRCLQSTMELPLWEELFALSDEEIQAAVRPSSVAPHHLVGEIETHGPAGLQSLLSLPKPATLDESQLNSLLAGLRQSVSLIQGPPGTGKSYIGALLTKAMLEHTSETILVICFTNHALDQFLEDLLDIGIPQELMVRLGQKSTARTKALQLREQSSSSRPPWGVIDAMKEETEAAESSLKPLLADLQRFTPGRRSIMELLEFSEEDSDFHAALQIPDHDLGEQVIGRRGKKLNPYYLYDRWRYGQDAGIFQSVISRDHAYVWAMSKSTREAKMSDWYRQLLQERISGIGSLVESYNHSEGMLREAWDQKDSKIIRSKRVVACTTTAAAKYTKHLRAAEPGIIVVEEAGEILESHVLTAMTPKTKQLILIGDHQQLRPKVNNYALTVERGDGFDLNRSLFERLVLSGFPHTTLCQQHRMCPEISSLVRSMTYEHLTDAPSTLKRNAIKGIRGRVIFIDHRYPELANSQILDRRDPGATVSRQNEWEASMVLKIVKYMAQQGYGTANQAVITPYLGQLCLLRQELAKENDPVLNDLDSFDLIKAGVMPSSSAGHSKGLIRLSTVDNFQGEESDVVVASLTRSNGNGEIGFLKSPDRLNVLLSRAREALIIIGNSETFLSSKQGVDTWKPFFDLLRQSNSIYNGLPVKCERHPDRQNLLKQPADFNELCPDGGCSEPCGTKLRCGVHDCPRRCHVLADHTKMDCMVIVNDKCPKNHRLAWRCYKLRPASCSKCDTEAKLLAKRQEADAKLDHDRQQKQVAYALRLAEIQDKIDRSRREVQEQDEDEEMEDALRQRQKDLDSALNYAHHSKKLKLEKQSTAIPRMPGSFEGSTDGHEGKKTAPVAAENDALKILSDARDDWEHQKRLEGETNEQLDELMAMIGLENVKAKVDLTVRQGTSLAKERFGASLLGNPGTGKTTVARLYAKFLSSVGALPGDEFVETTGAKLANEGVKGCETILNGIKKAGGGALFVDEAYQLTSGSSFGGAAVLDFLLAEVENLTGKVVFILAGYNKNMESFFAQNPGLPSRFPREIQFTDYEDDELLEIFNYGLKKKYGQRMAVEDGSYGLYARIVARRLGRGRGKVGFGNARAVENALSVIASRQAKRVRKERRAGKTPGDLLFKREDLIGAEPSDVLKSNQSWKKLQGLTGLTSVKESISALFDSITYNYQREIDEKPIMDFSLNKVFIGSPGTGKTTVAKLYGQILADIGLLSTDEGEYYNSNPDVPTNCVQSS